MNENKTIIKKVCPCCEKHTVRDEKHKKALLNRLKRIEGQVRGIEAMIENDAYCNDVLIQSAAVNAAMNAFNKELLASHIRGCVARDIKEGRDEVIDELVTAHACDIVLLHNKTLFLLPYIFILCPSYVISSAFAEL